MNISRRPGCAELFPLHAAQPREYPHLYESLRPGPETGRYSFLFRQSGAVKYLRRGDDAQRFFEEFSRETPSVESELPFCGGWLLQLNYELASAMTAHLSELPGGSDQVLAYAQRCDAALIVDHQAETTIAVNRDGSADELFEDLDGCTSYPTGPLPGRFVEEPDERFLQAVQRIVDYILAGDVYQVNLSRRWHWQGEEVSIHQLYAWLRERNPAPFAAMSVWPDSSVISASPERLFSVQNGRISTRPIAGTRPRGETPEEDAALKAQLSQHPKEQAEHIMLVDLERNDLGRVCEQGSVQVDELLGRESYATVHHIESTISGQLRPDVGLWELLKAIFPGGTITGCPKVRCMQIIAELEQRSRGPYTGSLGYISDNGEMDFNILIRSLYAQNGQLHFDAGAGIVADSIAQAELEETRAKAAGLIRVLQS